MSDSDSSTTDLYTDLAPIMQATIASSPSPFTNPETVQPVSVSLPLSSNNDNEPASTSTPTSTSSSGKLHRYEQNHMILYEGAFNPPHLGHSKVLESAFVTDLPGLRPMAALVVVRGNGYIKIKNKEAGETFLVSQQDRAELWRHHPDHKPQTWIYAAKQNIWEDFAKRLVNTAQEHGIRLCLVQLRGTDNLSALSPPPASRSRVAEIVTDAARKSDDFCKERRLQLPGYSAWQRFERSGEAGGEVWYCHELSMPSFRVYLLLSGQEGELVSSTRLRQVLAEKKGEEMVEELKTMALCPARLARMLQNGQVEMGEEEMEKLKNDSELQGLTTSG
jgi:phosphopantetheine adenylyltransferase